MFSTNITQGNKINKIPIKDEHCGTEFILELSPTNVLGKITTNASIKELLKNSSTLIDIICKSNNGIHHYLYAEFTEYTPSLDDPNSKYEIRFGNFSNKFLQASPYNVIGYITDTWYGELCRLAQNWWNENEI